MKNTMSFILPVIIVITIFFGAQIWMKNYDLRYIKDSKSQAIILAKHIRPPGTTPTYRYIGNRLTAIPVTNLEEPTLLINLNGKDVSVVIDEKDYNSLIIGEKIQVSYKTPKYYGKPFAVQLIK